MDEKMEIRLVNPTEDGFLQKIDWNKAELEANVRSIVEAYQGLVYTEDTVSDAKNDRAALRKLLNEIEDRRKLVKKKCMEPYEVFENISEEKYKKLSDEEAERYWTIQKGAYIVRGQYVVAGQWLFDTFSFRQGIILKDTIEELAKLRQHDEDFVTVTEYADNTIRGTDRTKHWRIGGA